MFASTRLTSSRASLMPLAAAVPLLLYLAIFLLYPTLYAIKLAFTHPLTAEFPSLGNFYAIVGDPLFHRAVLGNLVLPLLSLAVELSIGLGMALLFSQRFPARSILRAVAVVPFALPEIVYLTAMRYIFAPRGYANAALELAGLGPWNWLQPGSVAAFLTVAAVDAWHVTPVVFLVFASALSAIPEGIYEAARLDGARGWDSLRHITLPLLRPAFVAAVLLRGLDALRVFAAPLVLTGIEGVPVVSSYAYHQWSDYGDDGAAAAASVVLAALCLLLSAPLLRKRRSA